MNSRSRFLHADLDPSKPWLVRKRAIWREMKPFGRALFITGVFKTHIDGDGLNHVFRWWHPLSCVLFFVAFFACPFIGEKIGDVFPIRESKYWRKPENKSRLQWV